MTENFRQRSSEWHAARKNRLTASNFAAAMGINQYKSRAQLWREHKNLVPKFKGNEATQWGVANEATAIKLYEKITGFKVVETGFHIHSDFDWLGCSPDGLIGTNGGLEAKCPFYKKQPHATIPDYYMPQIQGSLEITDREWWDYVSWTPTETTFFRVYRSKSYLAWAFPLLENFWSHVLSDEEPQRLSRRPQFSGSLKIVKFDKNSLPKGGSTRGAKARSRKTGRILNNAAAPPKKKSQPRKSSSTKTSSTKKTPSGKNRSPATTRSKQTRRSAKKASPAIRGSNKKQTRHLAKKSEPEVVALGSSQGAGENSSGVKWFWIMVGVGALIWLFNMAQ